MIRLRNFLLAAALVAASPSLAFDIDAMSPEEEAAFGEAVREYILQNPQLLREWITELQSAEAAEQENHDRDLVTAHAEQLYDDGYSWVGGNLEGDITIVEFLDYRCSFCRRAHPEVSELVASDGNIRKIIKEFPILGDESVEASRFALAIMLTEGPEAYKVANDTLMEYRGVFSRGAFGSLADRQGWDSEAILETMDSDAVNDMIAANRQLGQQLAIAGTPTFVFEGELVRGYVSLAEMRELVQVLRTE
jgi:protein-disulfide isomerase